MQGNPNKEKYNSEGYLDITAYEAEKAIIKERKLKQRITNAITVAHKVVEVFGFEISGRITLVDKRTGRKYE